MFCSGDKIYSTVTDGKYEYLQGTSMAVLLWQGAATGFNGLYAKFNTSSGNSKFKNSVNKSTANDFGKYSEAKWCNRCVQKRQQYAYTHFNTIKNKTNSEN